MTTNIEKLNKVLESVAENLSEILDAEKDLHKRKSRLINLVSDITETFDSESNQEDLDELNDQLNAFALSVGRTWSGAIDYVDWVVGQRAMFWVPSTC